MTVHCRPAQSGDMPHLISLLAQLGYEWEEPQAAQLIADMRSGQGEVFVAVSSGAVVGLINAIVDLRLAEGKTGEIASLVVSANHRGQGVGRVLLQHAQAWLGERVSTIRIRTNVVRSDAHRFYTSAGYNVAKEQKVFTKDI